MRDESKGFGITIVRWITSVWVCGNAMLIRFWHTPFIHMHIKERKRVGIDLYKGKETKKQFFGSKNEAFCS